MKLSSVMQLPLEIAYRRQVLLAVELLDGVTLERVSRGITLTAVGLQGKPVINGSDVFVWKAEDSSQFSRLMIDPVTRPYEKVEVPAAELDEGKLNTIELPPRIDYPVPSGITGLRGSLIESRFGNSLPVSDARIHLAWRDDEDGNWHQGRLLTRTGPTGGFLTLLRLLPADKPQLEAGNVKVRLHVERNGFLERRTPDLPLRAGRITDPTEQNPRVFAWDEMELS